MSEPTMRAWFRRTYSPTVQAVMRKGSKSTEMNVVPKRQRDAMSVEPLEVVEGDGKKLDIMVRVPDASVNGWRRSRNLVLSAFVDVRSRLCVGWDIRVGERAEGVAAAMHNLLRDYGKPAKVVIDNGAAQDAALGERGKQDADDPLLSGICARIGSERGGPLPYHAWAEPYIERFYGFVRAWERRLLEAYWFSRPEVRAEGRDRVIRANVMVLPTIEQVKASFEDWLESEYHARPRKSLDGLTPRIVFEQLARKITRVPEAILEVVCSVRDGKPRSYGRDGVRVRGWTYRLEDSEAHWRLEGKTVEVRRPLWTADYMLLIAPNGRVLGRPKRLQMSSVRASSEDMAAICRDIGRDRKSIRKGRDAQLRELGGLSQRLLERKRVELAARERELRAQLPAPPEKDVVIAGGHIAARAGVLATGTDGGGGGGGAALVTL